MRNVSHLTLPSDSSRRYSRCPRAVRLRHRLRPDAIRPCHRADRKRRVSPLSNEDTADRERNKDLHQHRQDRYDCPANLQHSPAAVQPLPPDDELAADALSALPLSTSDLMLMQQISNTYGNSMGWLNASNTGTAAAASYPASSRAAHSQHGSRLRRRRASLGQQQIAAQGATVDIGDSVMSTNLQVLGTIRANQTARQTDIANLEAASRHQDPSQQTEMAALQRINQALLLQLRTQQDANQINANLALQQMIAQKQQQDAMKAGVSGLQANFNATSLPGSALPSAYQRSGASLDVLSLNHRERGRHGLTHLDYSRVRHR